MIIGFSGPAGAGKSTAAKYLVERHGFRLVKFAGPLKAMMRAILPGDNVNEWLEGALKETVHPVLGCTPRHAMQTLGTEWGRYCIDSHLWVNLAREDILSGGDVVLDDVRFENEVDMIGGLGGQVVRLRPKSTGHHPSGHRSEEGCIFDILMHNQSDIRQLHHNLELMLMLMKSLPG